MTNDKGRAELEILDELKNCSNRELFDALVAERARNLELRDAFLDVLHSPDCSHVHIQDCTHQNCEFYRARNVLLKKVSHERD
jgi:hypothetical protein